MRTSTILYSTIIAITILGCSGSETYRGSWKATNANGEKFEIVFEPKNFAIKDSTGNTTNKFDYTQNSVNITNSVETYGITIDDGRRFEINFPKADDESVGVIKDGNGQPVYIIDRNKYSYYESLYGLN